MRITRGIRIKSLWIDKGNREIIWPCCHLSGWITGAAKPERLSGISVLSLKPTRAYSVREYASIAPSRFCLALSSLHLPPSGFHVFGNVSDPQLFDLYPEGIISKFRFNLVPVHNSFIRWNKIVDPRVLG